MTYIFKNLTKNKIKTLFYTLFSNKQFKEHLNPYDLTDDGCTFTAIQVRNSYNEYEYTLSVQKDNYLHINNIDGLLDIKYDISELKLVVFEYDDILNFISFQNYDSSIKIGVWTQKVNPVSGDLDWLKFLEYAKLFADEVR